MENNYPNVLKRLSDFRRKMQLSQMDMKHIVDVTQGEYSYVENGKTKLSGEMLEMLYAKGWDIDYIISGIDNSSFELDLRDQFIEHPGISSTTVLRIAWVVFYSLIEESGRDFGCKAELDLLQMLLGRTEDQTVLFITREILDQSQFGLAYLFGMSVKLYRECEKGKRLLDAESLEIISRISHCRPTLFMNLGSEEWRIAEYVWNCMDSKMKKIAVDMINQNLSYLNQTKDE